MATIIAIEIKLIFIAPTDRSGWMYLCIYVCVLFGYVWYTNECANKIIFANCRNVATDKEEKTETNTLKLRS